MKLLLKLEIYVLTNFLHLQLILPIFIIFNGRKNSDSNSKFHIENTDPYEFLQKGIAKKNYKLHCY